jgi:hypothetical protein
VLVVEVTGAAAALVATDVVRTTEARVVGEVEGLLGVNRDAVVVDVVVSTGWATVLTVEGSA